MTHIENIAHILDNGITHQNSPNKNENYLSIGYQTLISKRENFTLFNGRKLGDYIPFYFGYRMPMLYVMMLGNRSIRYNLKPLSSEDIIYCVTSVDEIVTRQLDFVFSNGHGVNDFTIFFDQSAADEIMKIVDFNAVNNPYWNDENDLDLKRRKEAEFLVLNDIVPEAILGFVVCNENARSRLIDIGAPKNKIAVRPGYYF